MLIIFKVMSSLPNLQFKDLHGNFQDDPTEPQITKVFKWSVEIWMIFKDSDSYNDYGLS